MHRITVTLAILISVLVTPSLSKAESGESTRHINDFRNSYTSEVYKPGQNKPNPLRHKIDNWLKRSRPEMDTLVKSITPSVRHWRDTINALDFEGNAFEAVSRLNSLTNNLVTYKDDYRNYNKSDFWATPVQTIKEGGDCEDIALLKAVGLFLNGWPKEDLHLVIGYIDYKGLRTPHAVLVVKIKDDYYILDSFSNKILGFLEADFDPIYSLDREESRIIQRKK